MEFKKVDYYKEIGGSGVHPVNSLSISSGSLTSMEIIGRWFLLLLLIYTIYTSFLSKGNVI